MRALVCHAYGPIESLRIEDVPKPAPAAGEVLVKVGAAGVSFAAMLGIQGNTRTSRRCPLCRAMRSPARSWRWARACAISRSASALPLAEAAGGFAEYCVTIAANAVPIPDSMPYAEATNFPTLYPTAYGALKLEGRPVTGRKCCWCTARAAARA